MPPPNVTPAALARYTRYTSWPVTVEATWAHGLITDIPPVALPPGAMPAASNFVFDRPGTARKRGGTAYQSNALGAATQTYQVAWAPFSVGAMLVAVAPGGSSSHVHIYDTTAASSVDAGAATVDAQIKQPPVFYNDALWLLGLGTAGIPMKATNVAGTLTIANMAGSPPAATIGVEHGGYLILANTAANPNRLWFSPIPDPEATWDISNAYLDTAAPISALASVQGVLLVFHQGSIERVLGSVPPGTVGENMSLQPLSGQAGCLDPRFLVPLGGNVYFGDHSGAWVTNGASVTSITTRANGMGIAKTWRSAMVPYLSHDPNGIIDKVAAGTFGPDYVFFSSLSPDQFLNPTARFFLVYHTPTQTWSPFTGTGISCNAFTESAAGSEQTYGASARQGRILKFSDVFAAAPSNKADADATAVVCSLTTRVFGEGPYLKAFGHGHITYDMRDAASDNPTLAMTIAPGVEQTTFAAITESPFAETTDATRKRFTLNKDSQGLSVTLTQSAASSKTEIYALEIEHRTYGEHSDGT